MRLRNRLASFENRSDFYQKETIGGSLYLTYRRESFRETGATFGKKESNTHCGTTKRKKKELGDMEIKSGGITPRKL